MNHLTFIILLLVSIICLGSLVSGQKQPLEADSPQNLSNLPYYLQSPIQTNANQQNSTQHNINSDTINVVAQRALKPNRVQIIQQQLKRPMLASTSRQMPIPSQVLAPGDSDAFSFGRSSRPGQVLAPGDSNPFSFARMSTSRDGTEPVDAKDFTFGRMSTPRGLEQGLRDTVNISGLANKFIVPTNDSDSTKCIYDKRYLSRIDECLARKPYPTIGLVAFKNEDLMLQRSLSDKYGCQFILANGLFKNFQISKFNLDSDSQCLDNSKVRLNLDFSNVTLNYLWTLRCLNRADQLLDDSTHDGQTLLNDNKLNGDDTSNAGEISPSKHSKKADDLTNSICVGSSQNFGFASLQLSAMESQVDLATDIYKNWRVTNVAVAMASQLMNSVARELNADSLDPTNTLMATPSEAHIKEFVFESLDGDELNWRYLHMFQNWSRNRMHSTFLDQYRRFLWISVQNCLKEASQQLSPANKRPIEIFSIDKSI